MMSPGSAIERATQIALTSAVEHLRRHRVIEHIIFACFNDEILHIYQRELTALDAQPEHGLEA